MKLDARVSQVVPIEYRTQVPQWHLLQLLAAHLREDLLRRHRRRATVPPPPVPLWAPHTSQRVRPTRARGGGGAGRLEEVAEVPRGHPHHVPTVAPPQDGRNKGGNVGRWGEPHRKDHPAVHRVFPKMATGGPKKHEIGNSFKITARMFSLWKQPATTPNNQRHDLLGSEGGLGHKNAQ